eukprot:2388885-Amphidinium_carterae.1
MHCKTVDNYWKNLGQEFAWQCVYTVADNFRRPTLLSPPAVPFWIPALAEVWHADRLRNGRNATLLSTRECFDCSKGNVATNAELSKR